MTYALLKGNKRVTLRLEDMRAEKIARIFQVDVASLYLTDSVNIAVFPLDNGDFCSLDLTDREQYEVHGGERTSVVTPSPTTPATQRSFQFMQTASTSPQPFHFTPRPSVRSYQRSIHLSEIKEGRLLSTQVVVVRFTDGEANVSSMRDKIKSALGNVDNYIIADGQGNEIVESEGTTGLCFWKQNSRKLHAVETGAFRQWQQRKSHSRRTDDSAVHDLRHQVQELLEASHGLEAVTQNISLIVSSTTEAMQRTNLINTMKQTFSCLICTGVMDNPIFTSCCRSIVGCQACVQQWMANSTQCPKCRSEHFVITEVAGLSTALEAIKSVADSQH